jgi:phosphate-selective porin
MTDITLGLNWYLRDNARLMFNYVDVDTDDKAVVANDDPKVMTVRAQWDF